MRMKREDGMLVSSKEEVKGVWKRYSGYSSNALLSNADMSNAVSKKPKN